MPKGSKAFTFSLFLDSLRLNHSPPSMKKASVFLKEVFSMIVSTVKAKTMAMKSKTSTLRTRLIIFRLLRDKKFMMGAISHKIHALKGKLKDKEDIVEEANNATVLLGTMTTEPRQEFRKFYEYEEEEDDYDDGYPDLRHTLFDVEDDDGNEDEIGDCSGSVIEMVKTSKEQQGEEFRLEDEIDRVADIFIRRFHKKMRLEKLDSFKRHKEMLERSM